MGRMHDGGYVYCKFYYPIGLGVHKMELNAKNFQSSVKSRSRSEIVNGSG